MLKKYDMANMFLLSKGYRLYDISAEKHAIDMGLIRVDEMEYRRVMNNLIMKHDELVGHICNLHKGRRSAPYLSKGKNGIRVTDEQIDIALHNYYSTCYEVQKELGRL